MKRLHFVFLYMFYTNKFQEVPRQLFITFISSYFSVRVLPRSIILDTSFHFVGTLLLVADFNAPSR